MPMIVTPAPADAEALRREAAIIQLDPGGWPEPILPRAIRLPELYACSFPGPVGEFAEAVARATQTPEALALMLGLAATSVCVQRGWIVQPKRAADYTEPLVSWPMVLQASGARKSAVLAAMTEPLRAWEKRERDRTRSEVARVFAARGIAEKRIERLKIEAARLDDRHAREKLQAEIQREREGMPAEFYAPRLYVNDVTSERLQALLVENHGSIAILSDEAATLSICAGLYTNGQAALDVLLQGHAGSPVRVERQGRSAYVERPAVTLGLAVQPDVFAELCSGPRMRYSGFLARMLFALPASNLGSRDVRREDSVPADARAAYAARLHHLLDAQSTIAEPRVLMLSDAARESWFEFAERVEVGMVADGPLSHVTDWAGKLPGAIARIAALFELGNKGPNVDQVSSNAMDRACMLGVQLIDHGLAAFRLVGADEVEADCLAVIAWLRAGRRLEFTRRELHRGLESRLRTAERVARTCDRLIEWYVISREERRKPAGGGRPTTVHAVNPRVLS